MVDGGRWGGGGDGERGESCVGIFEVLGDGRNKRGVKDIER